MRLRTAVLSTTTLLITAIVAATVAVAFVIVDRAERRALANDLQRSRQVFEDLLSYRQSSLRSDCRVLANEPRMRATVATEGVTRDTVLVVINELRASHGSDLFLLTDGQGNLLADALDPTAEGFDMKSMSVVAKALADGEASAVWITNERPHQAQACRMAFGEVTVGIVVIGRVFDDDAAAIVQRQTGSALVVGLDGKRVAGSAFAKAPPPVAGAQQTEVELEGASYAAVGGVLPGYAGKRSLTYALLRSVDEALAPGRRLTRSVFVIAVIGVLAALVFALWISRRLSRPVDELVQFTEQIGDGKLEVRAQPRGPEEIRTLARSMNVMVDELDKSRRDLAAKGRLEREMEIANRIQTSILPRKLDVAGLEIAARMKPATEIGGDYYDVLPVERGCWIGIGDVAGHGLTAGLEMLMVQSTISALVANTPNAFPRDVLEVLNRVVFENVRNRMGQDEHVTLTLLRYNAGIVTFAGAHEDILVCRTGAETCERIATPGTWIAGMPEIAAVTKDTRFELGVGDVVVLYSDGVTEAMNADRELFGTDRLCQIVEEHRAQPVAAICDRVMDAVQAWQHVQDDDITIVIFRRTITHRPTRDSLRSF
jgi:sigma-B regulation protein RsbU (phosphoserine phosphatase)